MLKSLFAALLLSAPIGLALSTKASAYPYFLNSYSGNGYGNYSLTSGGYYGNINTYSSRNFSQATYYDNYGNYSTASCTRIGRYVSCMGY